LWTSLRLFAWLSDVKTPRLPQPPEQQVLQALSVRLIEPEEQTRFDTLLVKFHYLHSANLVGNGLRYLAEYKGQWMALLTWSAAAYHLKLREQWIGWNAEQCRRRLPLLVNNSRFLVLPEAHYPNLASRAMGLCVQRLPSDWEQRYGHAVLVGESFVDSQLFRGTAYKVSGWTLLGQTEGFERAAQDYYIEHQRPKQLWVRELVAGARTTLCAERLSSELALVEEKTPPRCSYSVKQLRSLRECFLKVPDWRERVELYPHFALLGIIACACFCGVSLGQRDLAVFASKLSQPQRRALGIRYDRKAGCYPAPSESTFFRALSGVDVAALQRVLLSWQEQLLGSRPAEDRLVILDGKTLRNSLGAELVSAFSKSGRWLGSELVKEDSNEIPAARTLLHSLELDGQMVILDALHTQDQTARQIVFDKGADYVLTVKDNQESLKKTLQGLVVSAEVAFPPSARGPGGCAPSPHGGSEPWPPRTAQPVLLGSDGGAGLLSRCCCGRTSDSLQRALTQQKQRAKGWIPAE
jgi:hypothetical protein